MKNQLDRNTYLKMKHTETNLINLDSSSESEHSVENFENCNEIEYHHQELDNEV